MSVLGILHVEAWRASDLHGKIWGCLGEVLAEAFRSSELTAASSLSNVDSINKALVDCYLSIWHVVVRLLLLVDLGDEGEEKFGAATGGSGGWRGCLSILVRGHSAGGRGQGRLSCS